MRLWLWPCRTASAPKRLTVASKARASVRPRNGAPPRDSGGWWMRMTRARSLAPVSCRIAASASIWRAPSRPVAISGPVGVAVLRPISATSPRTRTNGNASPRAYSRVALRPRRERRGELGHRVAHIGVVVAGREGYVRRLAERPHPFRRATKLRRQRDVDEIAGDRDMVGLLGAHVGDQTGERRPCRSAVRARASS